MSPDFEFWTKDLAGVYRPSSPRCGGCRHLEDNHGQRGCLVDRCTCRRSFV